MDWFFFLSACLHRRFDEPLWTHGEEYCPAARQAEVFGMAVSTDCYTASEINKEWPICCLSTFGLSEVRKQLVISSSQQSHYFFFFWSLQSAFFLSPQTSCAALPKLSVLPWNLFLPGQQQWTWLCGSTSSGSSCWAIPLWESPRCWNATQRTRFWSPSTRQ